jgi:tetratricopeptide (TPR) repeat protein
MRQPERHFRPSSANDADGQLNISSPRDLVEKYLTQAEACLERMDYVRAEKHVERAVEIADSDCPRADPLRPLARALSAEIALKLGDYTRAEKEMGSAISLASSSHAYVDGNLLLHLLWVRQADLLNEINKPDYAQVFWSQLMDAMKSDLPSRVSILMGMARSALLESGEPHYSRLMAEAMGEIQVDTDNSTRLRLGLALIDGGCKEGHAGRFKAASGLVSVGLDLVQSTGQLDEKHVEHFILISVEIDEAAGYFDKATRQREHALARAIKKHGENSAAAINVRQKAAEALLSFGKFERAEMLLQTNIAFARENAVPEHLVSATIDLAKAYQDFGLYREATLLLDGVREELGDELAPELKIALAEALALGYAGRGATQRAVSLLEKALMEACKIDGVRGIRQQASLHKMLASTLASQDPARAQEHLRNLYELLDHFRPEDAPFSNEEVQMTSLKIDSEDADPKKGVVLYNKLLAQFERSNGERRGFVKAQLMLRQARYMQKAGDTTDACEVLESARQLLEQRGRTQTTLYGFVLSKLVELLPSYDERVPLYQATGERLLKKLLDAWEGDTET